MGIPKWLKIPTRESLIRPALLALLVGLGSFVWVASAMASEPEVAKAATPDLWGPLAALLGALAIYFKTHTPAKDEEKAEKHQKILFSMLESHAKEGTSLAKRVADELYGHRLYLEGWMGGINEKLAGMKADVQSVKGKVETVERQVGEGNAKTLLANYRLKALERKAGIHTTGEIERPQS